MSVSASVISVSAAQTEVAKVNARTVIKNLMLFASARDDSD
jgi:hypothetical protein